MAANAGDIAAKHHLWDLGRRIPNLDDEARGTLEQHLREAANAGFARSQFRLYVLEDTKNKEVAYSWLEKAAIQYHREAICFLGSCLFNGLGTSRKFDVAFRLSLVGAKTDHFLAWQTLASCYHLGAGINKNLDMAFNAWCRAIRAGGSAEDCLLDLAESHPEYADRVKSFLQETGRIK
jgi:TPR repeat protein